MEYVKIDSTTTDTRKFTEDSVEITAPSIPTVYTAAELEAAVAIQTSGQFIYLAPGTYILTKQLVIPWAARGGGLIGLGDVTITGAVDADSALSIIAYVGGTMEYTLGGSIEIGGGAGKIGLSITTGAITEKTIVYITGAVHFVDNGVGIGFSAVHTGTGALRVYACCELGTGWDTVLITCKTASDKFHFRGISFDETLTLTAVVIAADFYFESCQVPLAGDVIGGNATMVCNIVNCWTRASTAVVAVNSSTDFPDFTPTVI